eukprot:6184034-Pleurochrysis_carterae.AAC.1
MSLRLLQCVIARKGGHPEEAAVASSIKERTTAERGSRTRRRPSELGRACVEAAIEADVAHGAAVPAIAS